MDNSMVDFGFSTDDVELDDNFGSLPDNVFLKARVDSCEKKDWDDGGIQISFTLKLIGGDHDGRLYFYDCNVKSTHNVPRTKQIQEKIGREMITKLAMAAGVKSASNSDDMIGKLVEFKLKTKKGKDGVERQKVHHVKPYTDKSVEKAEKGAIDW